MGEGSSERPDRYTNTAAWQSGPEVPMPATGPRILSFGAHEHVAKVVQNAMRSAGFRGTAIGIADDAASDERLLKVLHEDVYDAVTFGAFLTAQDPSATATEESTRWFNRVLNLVHQVVPMARIVLVRGPEHALADIRRVLAESAPGA